MFTLNARARNVPTPNIEGTCQEPTLNNNGTTLRDFATFSQFKITNTFFWKKLANQKISSQDGEMHLSIVCEMDSDHYLVLL